MSDVHLWLLNDKTPPSLDNWIAFKGEDGVVHLRVVHTRHIEEKPNGDVVITENRRLDTSLDYIVLTGTIDG